jgi:hypothetical protein
MNLWRQRNKYARPADWTHTKVAEFEVYSTLLLDIIELLDISGIYFFFSLFYIFSLVSLLQAL